MFFFHSFRKPKKKIKKLRQRLKAEDLEPIAEPSTSSNLGSRHGRYREPDDEDIEMKDEPQIKMENAGPSKSTPSTSSNQQESKRSGAEKDLSSYKDEWGEFLHKPADNIKEKKEAEKLREKLKQRKEKRFLEERLARIRTLGESDEETDNVTKWVDRNKRVVNEREEAKRKVSCNIKKSQFTV